MNNTPTNITDVYYDVIIKIISNLSIRDICSFMSASKWTRFFDTVKSWHDIMICKNLIDECQSLQNGSALIIDAFVEMYANKSFCSIALPKNETIRGLFRNHKSFAECFGYEYAKIYETLLNRSKDLDENSVRTYFKVNPINIYKMYLICTAKYFEYAGEKYGKNGNSCEISTIFTKDPIVVYGVKSRIKTFNNQTVMYGNKNHEIYDSSETIQNIDPESIGVFDLKPDLLSCDNMSKHKAIANNYKHKYELSNPNLSSEAKIKAVEFDCDLVNNLTNLSDDEIKTIAKSNPKCLANIEIKSEKLQLYLLRQLKKKDMSEKILKYVVNPTKETVISAIKISPKNIKYVFARDKMLEILEAIPDMQVFLCIVKYHSGSEEFYDKCAMIYPKIIEHMKKPSEELIHSLIEKDAKNIKYIEEKYITSQLVDWYCSKKFNTKYLLKKHPFALNLVSEENMKNVQINNPKILKPIIRNRDNIDLITNLLRTHRQVTLQAHCYLYDIIDLLNPEFSKRFGFDLEVRDFVDNYKLYIILEKAIVKKPDLSSRISTRNNRDKMSGVSKMREDLLENIIVDIRKAVIDKHPYLVSYMVVNKHYPAGFRNSQIYKRIIGNAIRKCPALIEIFEKISETQQTQAIVCSPMSAVNLNVALGKEAQELALILNPVETVKRIYLDDDVLENYANLNPYQYKYTKNKYLMDVLYKRRMFLAKQLMPNEFFDDKDYITSVKKIDELPDASYMLSGTKVYITKRDLLTEQQINESLEENSKFEKKLKSGDEEPPQSLNTLHNIIQQLQQLQHLQQLQKMQQLQQLQNLTQQQNPFGVHGSVIGPILQGRISIGNSSNTTSFTINKNSNNDSDDDSSDDSPKKSRNNNNNNDKKDCIIQ